MKEVASLQYGVIFKKAFSDPFVFKGFVRDILGLQIEIDRVETEKSFERPIGKVDTRFDLFAEDKKNRIIVDIQQVKYQDHYDRFLHYHCAAMLEQVVNAESYCPPLSVFTVVVLTSGDKHKKDVMVIDFDPKDLEGNGIHKIPHKVIYLCPKYCNEKTPEPYKEWLWAIQDSLDGTMDETAFQLPEIQKIISVIAKDLISPTERAKMFDEYGIDLLKKEQFEEGQLSATHTIASNMLKQGLEIELVTKLTGLSVEQLSQFNQRKE